MKVIHIFHSLKFSGAEIMYVNAAPFFLENGGSLTVMATANDLGDYANNFKNAGFSILHFEMPPLKKYLYRINYYKQIIKLFKSENYEVVHIHSSSAMWGFAICAWLTNIKSIYTFHNVFSTNWYSYFYHILLRFSAKYIFKCIFQSISDSVYDNEKNLFFNKTKKIYNWYGNKKYFSGTLDEKLNIREELNINSTDLVLISIGSCSSVKRHSEILKALPIVLDKIPNTIYLHLGTGETQCSEKELATSLDVNEKVIFCNNQQDVRKYLIASDIYLMTSKFEGISITTIEAMACGIPTILYNVPGLKDFNTDGENSFLIKEDSEILANTIIKLHKNKTIMEKVTTRAKNFVEKNFNLDQNVNKIFELYK